MGRARPPEEQAHAEEEPQQAPQGLSSGSQGARFVEQYTFFDSDEENGSAAQDELAWWYQGAFDRGPEGGAGGAASYTVQEQEEKFMSSAGGTRMVGVIGTACIEAGVSYDDLWQLDKAFGVWRREAVAAYPSDADDEQDDFSECSEPDSQGVGEHDGVEYAVKVHNKYELLTAGASQGDVKAVGRKGTKKKAGREESSGGVSLSDNLAANSNEVKQAEQEESSGGVSLSDNIADIDKEVPRAGAGCSGPHRYQGAGAGGSGSTARSAGGSVAVKRKKKGSKATTHLTKQEYEEIKREILVKAVAEAGIHLSGEALEALIRPTPEAEKKAPEAPCEAGTPEAQELKDF